MLFIAVSFEHSAAVGLAQKLREQAGVIDKYQAALAALAEYLYLQTFAGCFAVEAVGICVNIKLLSVKGHQARSLDAEQRRRRIQRKLVVKAGTALTRHFGHLRSFKLLPLLLLQQVRHD